MSFSPDIPSDTAQISNYISPGFLGFKPDTGMDRSHLNVLGGNGNS